MRRRADEVRSGGPPPPPEKTETAFPSSWPRPTTAERLHESKCGGPCEGGVGCAGRKVGKMLVELRGVSREYLQ